jgi:hypothetical protein
MVRSDMFLRWERSGYKREGGLRQFLKQEQSRPYIRQLVADRYVLYHQYQQQGWTRAQYLKAIRTDYIAKDCFYGTPDKDGKQKRLKSPISALIRRYRDKAVESGEYIIPVRPHHVANKGNILAQKQRYRNREKQSTTQRDRQWADELQATMRRQPWRAAELTPQLERMRARIGRHNS